MVLLYQRQFTEHDEKINYAKNHYFDQTISFSPFIFSFEWKNMKDIYNFCKYTPVHDSIRLWRFLMIHISEVNFDRYITDFTILVKCKIFHASY